MNAEQLTQKLQKINLLCADCKDNECDGTECDLPDGYVRSMVFGVRSQPRQETPEQCAERIFKEDEEKRQEWEEEQIKQLPERRLKRIAVIEKNRVILDASIQGKQKGIRFRRYFHDYVNMVAYRVFETEREEYKAVGKPGRLHYTEHGEHVKAYNKKDPMNEVIGEIMTEFGCFDY
jgi:hypothetical protein